MSEFWSEEAFQARIEARARELGQPLSKLLGSIGLGHDTLKRNVGSRSIPTLEKIAAALKWDLGEVMGFSSRIDIKLSREAFHAAQKSLERLPPSGQNEDNLVLAHASIYDLLVARQREGRLSEDPAIRAELLRAYEEALVKAWEGNNSEIP